MSSACLVIFGAAVRPDGSPSGTLRRRVEGAILCAKRFEDPRFLVTGGLGRFPPSEAEVMKNLLTQAGISGNKIIVEDKAHDTLSSILNSAYLLNSIRWNEKVVVCTSPYHIPRCLILFRMSGIDAEGGQMPSDRPALGVKKWLYYWLRELAAIPYDVLALILNYIRNKISKA